MVNITVKVDGQVVHTASNIAQARDNAEWLAGVYPDKRVEIVVTERVRAQG